VDPLSARLQNMKSHGHHVFMEVLLPIAFSSLPVEVLEPLLALSDFFKNLCANEPREDLLMEMRRTILTILCKLEIIFPPTFWNVRTLASSFSTRSIPKWASPLQVDVSI